MFKSFGIQELLIILAIVILLFGVGRIGKIAKELGGGIKSFKDGLQGQEDQGMGEKSETEKKDD